MSLFRPGINTRPARGHVKTFCPFVPLMCHLHIRQESENQSELVSQDIC